MLKKWSEELSSSVSDTRVRMDGETTTSDAAADTLVEILDGALENDKAVWIIGNGGSVSIMAHLAVDFMNKLGLRCQALTDTSLLTCMANDFGYENVYARPLSIMGRKGDILIAISSSGNSENIVRAVAECADLGMKTVTLSGFKEDNRLFSSERGLNFYVPSTNYGTVEVGHMAILHTIADHMEIVKNQKLAQNKASAV
ncbi:MAG: phosphoheptose isomerase [Alphaproteobacteria bacterium]|nr:MAG: phosphoheptose isomerase [Alphaproteobacteria bacterium]